MTYRSALTAKTTWGDFDVFNNPGFMDEYAFSSALYRKTEYDYEHNNLDGDDTTFLNAHIVDRKARVIVRSAGGTTKADASIDYGSLNGGVFALGNPESMQEWTGTGYVTTLYQYDAQGDQGRVQISGGGVTRTTDLTYYRGVLDRVQINGKQIFDRVINANSGRVTSETNVHSATTSFSYDSWERLTSINPPLDAITNIYYQSQQVTMTKGGSTVIYLYDDFGRLLTTKTQLDGGTYTFDRVAYDSVGNVSARYEAATSATSVGTTFSYDALGRVTQALRPDGTTTITYGADTETISDSVSTKVITRDAFGRITSVQDAGFTTNYDYDELDRLTRVDHPGAASDTTFSYNHLGWLLFETHPESGTTAYDYNGVGELYSKQDSDGDLTFFSHDNQGRVTLIDRSGTATDIHFYYDGQAIPGDSAGYTNATNELTGMSDETGSTAWENRDSAGRVTRAERRQGGTVYATEYDYDSRGNLLSIDYPHTSGEGSRTVVGYTYNNANLVDGVTVNGTTTVVQNIVYNGAKTPTTIVLGNGVRVQIPTSPTLRNRPDKIYTVGATQGGLDADIDLDYSYTSRGQVDWIVFNNRFDDYSYNSHGFLTGISYGGQGSVSFGYDTNGNMTTRSSTSFPQLNFTRSYGSQNRISGYQYSSSGNLMTYFPHISRALSLPQPGNTFSGGSYRRSRARRGG